jgi:hypothetical protein
MACALTKEQVLDVYELLYRSVLDGIENSSLPVVSLDKLVKEVYNAINEATEDSGKALQYAQAIPDIFNLLLQEADVNKYLVTQKFDFNKLATMRVSFEDLNEVAKTTVSQKKTKKDIESDIKAINVESQDIEKGEFKNDDLAWSYNENNGAKIVFPLATTAQEAYAENPETVSEEDKNKKDVEKILFYDIVKQIIEIVRTRPTESNNIMYQNVSLALTAMSNVSFPYEALTTSDKEFLAKNPGKEGGIYAVVTDVDGNFVYFKESGDITEDPTEGRIVYQYLRKVNLVNGQLLLSSRSNKYSTLVEPEVIANRQKDLIESNPNNEKVTKEQFAEMVKEIADKQQKDLNDLYNLRNFILETDSKVALQITNGTFGIPTAKVVSMTLEEAGINVEDIKHYQPITTGVNRGKQFFMLEKSKPGITIDQMIFLQRGDMDIELADKIANVLTTTAMLKGQELTPKERESYFEIFINNTVGKDKYGKNLPTNRDRITAKVKYRNNIPALVVTINGEEIAQDVLYTPETKEKIKNHLLEARPKFVKKGAKAEFWPANVQYNNDLKDSTFNDYLIEGDKIKEAKTDYFNFIKPYVKIEYSKEADAFNNGVNAYLNFAVDPSFLPPGEAQYAVGRPTKVEPVQAKAKPKADKEVVVKAPKAKAAPKAKTEKEAVENNPATKISLIDDIINQSAQTVFKRSKALDSYLDKVFTNKADRTAAEQWWNNSPLSKYIRLERITDVVNSDAFATWSGYGIKLYEADGGTMVDVYHEAWHGFSQLFLTKEEKIKLYSEVMANGKWSKMSFEEIEEEIAEDFRTYAKGKGKQKRKGFLGRVFEKMYNFLKQLFGKVSNKQTITRTGDIASVKELFDKLYRASENPEILSNLKPSMNNLIFSKLNRSKTINSEFAIEESLQLANSMDNMMAVIFQNFNRDANTTAGAIKILKNPDNKVALYKELYNKFENIRLKYTDAYEKIVMSNMESTTPDVLTEKKLGDLAGLLARMIENFGDIDKALAGKEKGTVIAYHIEKSKYKVLADQYIEIEDPTNLNQTQLFKTDGGNTMSSRELASEDTLMLLSSIFKTVKNEDGTLTQETDMFGIPQTETVDIIWNRLAKILEGSFDEMEMYSRLWNNSENYPELKQLQRLLPNPMFSSKSSMGFYDSNLEFDAETSFWQDFKKPRIPYVQLNLTKDEKTGLYAARLAKANFDVYGVVKDWTTNFITSDSTINPFVVEDELRRNMLNTAKIISTFSNEGVFNYKRAAEFLKAIGIELDMTSSAIQSIVNNKRTLFSNRFAVDRMFEVIKIVHAAGNKPGAIQFKKNPLKYLLDGLPEDIRVSKDKDEEVRGRIRALAELQNMYSDSYSNFSVQSPERNRVWEHFLDNTITRVITSINKANTWQELTRDQADPNGLFKHMRWLGEDNNTHTAFSKLLNSVFELDPMSANYGKKKTDAKLNIQNVSGTQLVSKKEANNVGTSTASMDATSKYLQEFHSLLLNGVEEFMRHASKNTSMGLTLSNAIETYNGKNADNLYVDIEAFRPGNFGPQKAFEILAGYISGEGNRIFRFSSDINKYKEFAGYNRKVKRKDGKITMAGQAFTAFDDVLSIPVQKELYKIIQEAVDNKVSDFNLMTILDTDISLRQKVAADVAEYFNKQTIENTARLNKAKFIDPALMKRADRSDMELTAEDVENTLVKAYTYNSWIHKFETAIIAYGDFAQYNHDKEEFHKRNAGLGSGGRGFRSDLRAQAFVNNPMSFKRYYADRMGYQSRNYDGTLHTAILKEVEYNSVMYDEYRDELEEVYFKKLKDRAKAKEAADLATSEYFKKDGAQMKIGDGQGHINMESYRMLKKLEGNWSDAQEILYRKVAMGETITVEDVVEYFPPYKLQYYGNMQTTGIPITSFHKFSLAPIIPGVAIPGTPMYDLHKKMMEDQIDYVLFESGSKVGHIGSGDEILNSDGSFNTDVDFTVNVVFAEYLKNQTEINSQYKNKSIFSTQLRKMILEGLYTRGVIDTTDEDKITVPAVTRYLSNVSEYTELLKIELLEEIGYEETKPGEYVPKDKSSISKLLNVIRTNLEREDNLSDELIEFIDVAESNEELLHDLSFHPESGKIEKLLLSMINKRIIKQKVKGEPLVQVSSALYENSFGNIAANFDATTKEEKERIIKKYVGTNLLPTYHRKADGKTAAMKVMIALQGNYVNLLNLDYKGAPIENIDRLNEAIKDDEWLDTDSNRKAITMAGVRIPVQGLNSMEFMEVYHFLAPQAGNIIIPPAEIVAKSGGDFDIDKLTIFMTNIGEDGKLKKKEFANNSLIKEKIKELKADNQSIDALMKEQKAGLENELIEDIKSILELPQNYASLITPNGTFLLKHIAEKLAKDVSEYDPFNNMMSEGNESEKNKKVISPTRVLESGYNIYKHESNIIGKRTLGLGAIENTFNVILNAAGAYMPSVFGPADKLRESLFYLRHNKMNVNGEEVISISDQYDVDGVNKVADIISQMMNGWVDVEKDAWIFFIQGNYEVAPILLYLVKAGVPIEEAVYFVSQPLVREYVEEQRLAKSTYAEILGKKPKNPWLAKYQAATNVIAKNFDKKVLTANSKAYDRYTAGVKLLDTYFKDRSQKHFTKNEMLDLITEDNRKSEKSQAMFLQYLMIEQQIGGLTSLKMSSNPDTAVKSTLSDVEQTEANIENLQFDNRIPQEILRKLMSDSVISSFFNGPLALAISRPLFKLRYHKLISEYLIAKDAKIKKDIDVTFPGGNKEMFANIFRNDIVSFILQNALRKYKLGDSYMSYEKKEALPTATADELKFGAYVKNETLYIDTKQLKSEFEGKAWSTLSNVENDYESRGLYPLSPATFMRKAGSNFNEYLKFVSEREYLRSIYTIAEVSKTKDFASNLSLTKELMPDMSNEKAVRYTYEKFLADKALTNTFNFYHLFSDPENAMGVKLSKLLGEYPELTKEYSVLGKMKLDSNEKNTVFNVYVADKDYDNDKSNRYTKQLAALSNPGVVKVEDIEENKRISDFFRDLNMFAFLQTGLNKTKLNFTNIAGYGEFLNVVESESGKFIKALEEKEFTLLDNFYDMFITENLATNLNKQRYKDYLSTMDYDNLDSIKAISTPTERRISNVPTQLSTQAEFSLVLKNEEENQEGIMLGEYDIINKGSIIGNVFLPLGFKNYTIKGISFKKEFLNKGLGKAFYKWLGYKATKEGATLSSDFDNTSESAKRVWESLKKENLAQDTQMGYRFNPKNLKEQAQPDIEDDTEVKSRVGLTETKRDQIYTYNDSNTKNEFYYTNISMNNPDVVFIFGTSKKEYDAQYKVKFNNQSYFGSKVPDMSIDFLTGMNNTNDGFSNLDPAKFGALKDLWERRIAAVKSLTVGGVSIAFPETGFGNISSMPQELFVYLSKRLYEEFGYLNPGSTMYNDMMDIIGRTQGISDEEILQQFGLEEDPFKCR